MSLIGDIVVELVGGLLFHGLGRLFHFTGRPLMFLLTLGYVRVPSERHGGAGGDGWLDFGTQLLGFLFWVAALALTIYLLVT
ncbi:MAG TPA: hypothetical protein VMG08_00280 [Allosphingosinicella sp.]|nr:hypothetical protein [Allosphingosinicella sp.]